MDPPISGYLGPGGIDENAAYPNCTGGATGFIDRMLLPEAHLYQWSHIHKVYGNTQPFDPEGLFGSLLTIVHVFVGLQAGVTLIVYAETAARLRRFAVWSTICGLVGGALAGFTRNDGFIPINKGLWSLSYLLVTCSLGFGLLAVCYVLTDVGGLGRRSGKLWSGAPFHWAGCNAILMYCGHTMMHQMLPFRWRYGAMNEHLVLLMENGWTVSLWLVVAWWLYRRNLFVSI